MQLERSSVGFCGFCGWVVSYAICLLPLYLAAQTNLPRHSIVLRLDAPAIQIPRGFEQFLENGRIWQAQVVLSGKSWRIAAIEPPKRSRSLLHKEVWMFLLQEIAPSPAFVPRPCWTLSPSQKLFLDSHAYEIQSVFEKSNNTHALRVILTEKLVPLGPLRIEGRHLTRLQLLGEYMVCLDTPKPIEHIPVGSYPFAVANLGTTNVPLLFTAKINHHLQISETKTATFAARSPLTNSVTAAMRGRTLRLDYRLFDAEGHSYRSTDTSKPPHFTVFLNGQQVHTGAFEFG